MVGFVALTSYLYRLNTGILIRNIVYMAIFGVGLLFVIIYSVLNQKLDQDNAEHPYRIILILSGGMILSAIFPYVDVKGWFFLGIAVSISLFSNSIIALYTISGLILFSLLLSGSSSYSAFFVYYISSALGILLFQKIDENFKVGFSLFTSAIILFLLETAGFILLENSELTAEQFVMPIVNIFINSVILFFSLKYYNEKIANRYRLKYLELNDQQYGALLRLKDQSIKEYYRSIHTAYLVERMAPSINCDYNLVKNMAYYHRFKSAFKLDDKACEQFVYENNFPPKAAEYLLDFYKKTPIVTKEAALVYISDIYITSVMTIFEKDKKAQIDYSELIDTILKREVNSTILSQCDLSISDIYVIKETIVRERLYYDFLR